MGEDRLGASQLKGDRPKLKGEDCSPLRADSGEGPRRGATSLSQAEVVSHPVCSSQPLCGVGDTDCESQSVSLRASVAGPQSLKGECSDGECAASVDSTTHVRRRPSTRRRDSAEREERDIPPVRTGELDSEPGADAGRSPACPPAMLVRRSKWLWDPGSRLLCRNALSMGGITAVTSLRISLSRGAACAGVGDVARPKRRKWEPRARLVAQRMRRCADV